MPTGKATREISGMGTPDLQGTPGTFSFYTSKLFAFAGEDISGGEVFDWNDDSTYIQEPPFFVDMTPEPTPIRAIEGARVLVKAGDSIAEDEGVLQDQFAQH